MDTNTLHLVETLNDSCPLWSRRGFYTSSLQTFTANMDSDNFDFFFLFFLGAKLFSAKWYLCMLIFTCLTRVVSSLVRQSPKITMAMLNSNHELCLKRKFYFCCVRKMKQSLTLGAVAIMTWHELVSLSFIKIRLQQ